MAGTIPPIAALTVEDHGPINTVVSIVLPTISILIATVRMAMSQHKLSQSKPDDIVFGTGLCFGVLTSVLSHFCVRAGLGRHQETLDQEQIEHYSKMFWITQMSGVLALAFAKLSLVLLFKRIAPQQVGSQGGKWLMSTVAIYTLLSLFLIAFQCQLPRPWILNPLECSTHGNVYYPITISNMLTDVLLALWIFPLIWGLHMRTQAKSIVLWLFGSRLLICVVDMGRMVAIHRALQSEDQTRSQLLWAIMDQIVIHLSINHATLPRIQTFLSHLQVDHMGIQMTAAYTNTPLSGERSNTAPFKDHPRQHATAHQSNAHETRRTSYKGWNTLCTSLVGSLNRTPSISEQPLTEQSIELSSTGFTRKGETAQKREWEHGRSAATSLSNEGVSSGDDSTGRLASGRECVG